MIGHLRILPHRGRSLQGRIVVSVGSALLLILLLFDVIALWALHQGTELAFQGRVSLASAYATHIDESLAYLATTLQSDADALVLQSGDLSEAQRARLDGLRRRTVPSAALALVRLDGSVPWRECADPCTADGEPGIQLDRAAVPARGQHRVSERAAGASILARVDVPVVDDSGRVAGVLVAEMDPRHRSLVLLPHPDADRGIELALITADGRSVAGADPMDSRVPGGARRAAAEHARLIGDASGSPRTGYRVHDEAVGVPMSGHVVAYARLSSIPSWMVTVEQPVDEALGLPRRIQWYVAAYCGATLAFVMILAFLDVRRVTAPIRRLTAAAERLAAGGFDQPVAIGGTDEVGELARAFESMRVRLRDSVERERTLAVLEERERIAAEMHDGLGQVLGYVIMKSLAVAELLDTGHVVEARAQVDQLQGAAREAYADVRENILALRTTLTPDRDLLAALRDYAAGFERQTGIAVDLAVPRDEEGGWMEPTAEVQLVRIVQEALTNVRKHARARRVSVRLTVESDRVQAEVVDDGRGFDPSRVAGTGTPRYGLQIMRERAEGAGGTFVIGPDAGGGTRVTVIFPRRRRGGNDAAAANTPGR